ncbi:MAG: response regulator [Desulfurivibrionaceae bacterium]|jgi:DNA-binding NtrC family response regulator
MPGKQYKLLIVDDDQVILKLLERVLATTPHQVETCNDPIKAYEMIEDKHFDIVLSDISMPGMDGVSLLRKIKNFNGTIQVIMITGYTTINNTINTFRYGAVDIIFKPIKDKEELLNAVTEAARRLDRINTILKTLISETGMSHD